MDKRIARELLLMISLALIAATSLTAAKIVAFLVGLAFIIYLIKKAI